MTETDAAEPLRGLPAAVCWTAADLARQPTWKLSWTPAILAAFRDEVRRAGVQPGADLEALPRGAVTGDAIGGVARAAARELHDGRGVVWIGSPNALPGVAALDPWELRLLALILAWELGPTIERYGRLYDVVDHGESYQDRRIPVSQTRAETAFHTDSSAADCNPEIVGLLCLRAALAGGDSQIASACTVFARLAAAGVESIGPLFQAWIRDLVTPGVELTRQNLLANRIPVFSRHAADQTLTFRYMRYWIERGHARAELPLPDEAVRALDRLDAELARPGVAFTLRLQPGEILLIHNRRIAHNRTAFVDDAEPANRRWLVRFWVGASAGSP
jgi:hypothetical protein